MKSMTGFGRAEWSDDTLSIKIEIRSVNNRSLKINFRLPDILQSTSGEYEMEIEKLIRNKLHRGAVYLNIECELLSQFEYSFDTETIKNYYTHLCELQKELGCKNGISLASVIALPGTLQKKASSDVNSEAIWEKARNLIVAAIDDLTKMREKEGRETSEAIQREIKVIKSLLSEVEVRKPYMLSEYRERLHNRVSQLLEGTDINVSPDDLCKEIAIFAERSDITEEIDRLQSHLDQLTKSSDNSGPVGRKLEFIAQEMFREANTMASKSNDAEMIQHIIEIKGEIEKIREQVLNVE